MDDHQAIIRQVEGDEWVTEVPATTAHLCRSVSDLNGPNGSPGNERR